MQVRVVDLGPCSRRPLALAFFSQGITYTVPGIVPWDDAPEQAPDWDLIAQPDPGFEFDQRVSW
jgi:hypothetical protein